MMTGRDDTSTITTASTSTEYDSSSTTDCDSNYSSKSDSGSDSDAVQADQYEEVTSIMYSLSLDPQYADLSDHESDDELYEEGDGDTESDEGLMMISLQNQMH